MKKYLEKFIAKKQQTIKELRDKMKASQDMNEVRSIGDQIASAQEEIDEARAKLAECNAKLGTARAELGEDEETQEGDEENQDDEEEDVPDDNQRSRNFRPGRVVGSFDSRSTATQNRASMERRANDFARTGRQSVPVTEARATMISGGKIATPTEVGGINDAFTQVSSIVDMVKVTDCTGMGAYKVAYEIAAASAAKQTEGAAVAESDMTFDFVTITPETAAVMSYITKQVRKQSPLNYTEKVRASALTALRKYAAKMIVTKAKASALTQKKTITAIDATTLRTLALSYGGDLGVEGGAVLVLNKASLIKFGDVRGTQEKKAVYEITPDTSNPNTGIIKDGGLSVKYCIESNLADEELLYGNMHCIEMGLFSDYEIAVSEDRNIEKLMLTIVGDVELGCEVVVKDGIILASKASA
jgi:HK97 family phage major capsid protein